MQIPVEVCPRRPSLWFMKLLPKIVCLLAVCFVFCEKNISATEAGFTGKYFSGKGDLEYVRLMDVSRRMFSPDPEFQNISMLYITNWNGLVEGPTWDAWWIQNSYGTTFAALPFLQEPFLTFLQNSQDLWFDQMGDGKRVGAEAPFNWVGPDGVLCDAARPGWIVYKQGDGRTSIHDWGMEFTAAGLLMQAELLLISRDVNKVAHYLPKLERCANFIETRRDTNDLFLAGPAGNLLAPSYAGWKKSDGTYWQAYLTGLSITYIAALDRLIEVEVLAKQFAQAKHYGELRDAARKALPKLTTEEGYFIRSLDPDGVRHGVFGAKDFGYFESSPNQDAIAFRVADQSQSEKIFQKISSLPELRPHRFILPNYPSYDDMYEKAEGLWAYGTWVNGGHWSTCEARMILAYYRLGKFDDAKASMKQLLTFARKFRMDNPLVKFGSEVYQPNQPINLCYDSFGPPAAMIRGLFEYKYSADGLTLFPHIPPTLSSLDQKFPVRLGRKQIYLSTRGRGKISRVEIDGRKWKWHDDDSIFLSYNELPDRACVAISLGNAVLDRRSAPRTTDDFTGETVECSDVALQSSARKLQQFANLLAAAGLSETYESAHASLALEAIAVVAERQKLLTDGKLNRLEESSQIAADQSYLDTATKLCRGLEANLEKYKSSPDPKQQKLLALWRACEK